MKASYLNFNACAEAVVASIPDRSRIVSAALAIAVAYSPAAAIPSAPVTDPANYYQMSVQMAVERLVYAMNEGCIFDPKATMDLVRALWLVRYSTVHPHLMAGLYAQQHGFFDSLICASLFVSEETHCFLNEFKQQIFGLVAEANKIVAEEGNV